MTLKTISFFTKFNILLHKKLYKNKTKQRFIVTNKNKQLYELFQNFFKNSIFKKYLKTKKILTIKKNTKKKYISKKILEENNEENTQEESDELDDKNEEYDDVCPYVKIKRSLYGRFKIYIKIIYL
jgi:hypothetical protein